MRIADKGKGPELFCCEWVPYPQPGADTSCSVCGSVFTVRTAPELPAPNFYAADGPAYADDALDALMTQGALWSPDFDAYAAGETDQVTCVLCESCPCQCPEFGSPEYFELLHKRYGSKP